MKVCFLVNDLELSGGVGVVIEHARRLGDHHGFDVTLALARPPTSATWRYEQLAGVHVATLAEARRDRFDVALATWWETTTALLTVPAERYGYFVQSLEDRFYEFDEPDRLGAAVTLGLPVAFITEARWIAATLDQLRPDAPCYLVRNGIDKSVFAVGDALDVRRGGPLRILIEGNPAVWFKGVREALGTVEVMREPRHVTVVTAQHEDPPADRVVGPLTHREMADLYAESDVVLKLSRVEGMFGPPLEAMHRGATCVVTPVTGHDEYVEHGVNGLVADWDDSQGTARLLDLLARDRALLHRLRLGAVETARRWPTTEQSSQFMALALRRIADGPVPDPVRGSRLVLDDVRAGVEHYRPMLSERRQLHRRMLKIDRVAALPPLNQALRLRNRRSGRLAMRVARGLWRRLRA
jgi:glycosyltransferase involved in cell wall biosynthesis